MYNKMSQFVNNTTDSKNNRNIKYIFVSDIEGCETHGRFTKVPQNTTMCDTPFYEALEEKLKDNNDVTHVCFLGDYFDHGPGVLNSIVQIAKLKLRYKDKVHIILGNRDVNKFRIYFEKSFNFMGTAKGKQYGPFKSNKETTGAIGENTTNMRQWMANTMGINNDANRNGLICGFNNENDALNAFKQAFSPDNFSVDKNINDLNDLTLDNSNSKNNINAFSVAVNVIYKQGNLVEYIKEDNLLLSHAGGVHARMVSIPEVPKENNNSFKPWWNDNNVVNKVVNKVVEEEYYKALQNKREENIATHKNIIETEKEETQQFTAIVESYRNLYSIFLDLFGKTVQDEPIELLNYHYLIQGFGLEGGFIGSCGHTRHMAIIPGREREGPQPSKFDKIKLLKDYPLYSAFGHVNYGLEYPIIYKRGDKVMIACDTSVGFRNVCQPFYMNMLDLSKEDYTKYKILSYTTLPTPTLNEYPYSEDLKTANDGEVIKISNAIIPAKKAVEAVVSDTPSACITGGPGPDKGGKRTTRKRHSKKSKKKKIHRKKTRKNRKTKRTKR